MSRARIRVLFLAANPDSTTPLHAGREVRAIRDRLAQAADPHAVEIVERWAVRPGDLQQRLVEVRPHVVHFSGHGNTEYELMLEGEDGSPRPVGKGVLAEHFRLRGEGVRLVVLSACHSLPQAEAVAEHVDCARDAAGHRQRGGGALGRALPRDRVGGLHPVTDFDLVGGGETTGGTRTGVLGTGPSCMRRRRRW